MSARHHLDALVAPRRAARAAAAANRAGSRKAAPAFRARRAADFGISTGGGSIRTGSWMTSFFLLSSTTSSRSIDRLLAGAPVLPLLPFREHETEGALGSNRRGARSLTSHETPVKRLRPAANTSSRMSVPPVNPRPCVTPLPTIAPIMPPGASGRLALRLYSRTASMPLLARRAAGNRPARPHTSAGRFRARLRCVENPTRRARRTARSTSRRKGRRDTAGGRPHTRRRRRPRCGSCDVRTLCDQPGSPWLYVSENQQQVERDGDEREPPRFAQQRGDFRRQRIARYLGSGGFFTPQQSVHASQLRRDGVALASRLGPDHPTQQRKPRFPP